MHRQPPLDGPIAVVGDAAPPGLFDLWPIATRRDCPATPTLGDRDQGLSCPALAIDGAETDQWPLAAVGAGGHTTRGPSRHRRHDALTAQVCSPPTVVGLGIVGAIGQQMGPAPSSPGVRHQGATRHLVPSRPPVSDRSTPSERSAPHCHRPLQLGPVTGALNPPAAGSRGWPGHAQRPWNPRQPCGREGRPRAGPSGRSWAGPAPARAG
jgi:hypothetical protein